MIAKSLADWLLYLEQLHPFVIDMGLERARAVAKRLSLKRPARRVITVTGTNGKGSTCAFLSALLRAHGFSVGLYSSPHLLRYNERVVLDGVTASDQALCEAFAVVETARAEISLTYFEMGTLAALWLFEQACLDYAVLEVGLGGRLDAVNLIDADFAVVSNIGLDHVQWLGTTRDSVAFEKAGIFRFKCPVICGDIDPPAVLLEQADKLQSPLYLRAKDFDLKITADSWDWCGTDANGAIRSVTVIPHLELPVENAAVAIQAFALLDEVWDEKTLVCALQATKLSGRFERRACIYQGKQLNLVLDVGHNPHAAVFLASRLQAQPCSKKRYAVFGLLEDKDLPGILSVMHPVIDAWAVTALSNPRSRTATALYHALIEYGAHAQAYLSVARALEAQCMQADDGDEILIFGSFYCVAEAMVWLEQQEHE